MAEPNNTRMRIYYYLLTQAKPVPIRKIQRDLGISTPSLVLYHIRRLKEMGYVRETEDGYVVNKVVLEDYVKIRHALIPKVFFMASFLLTALILTWTVLRPHGEIALIYSSLVMGVGGVINTYEAIKKRSKLKF